MAILKLVYPGMKKRDQERWLKAQRDSFRFPNLERYKIKKKERDDEAIVAKKEKRRAEYLKGREKEWAEKLSEFDSFKSVAGVFFRKGEVTSVDTESGDVDKDKLLSLVGLGVLRLVEDNAKAEKSPGKPEAQGGPESGGDVADQSEDQPRRRGRAPKAEGSEAQGA